MVALHRLCSLLRRETSLLRSPRVLSIASFAILIAAIERVDAATDGDPRVVTHAGTLVGANTWDASRVHRIVGAVRVAPGGLLRITAGARVEAEYGASITVDRTARIEAVGTLYEPVVLSCAPGTPLGRDCWEGLLIAGHAPVNGGTSDSPPARQSGAAGCAQRSDEALTGPYGGCDVNDNSGILRHVRVQYATRGLQLLGVGRGTQIEFVQVHGAGAGGVSLRGGTVDLRHLLVTASGPTGVDWRSGWTGRMQHAIVQLPPEGGVALNGSNDAVTPSATPRSAPELYNVTAVQLPTVSGPSLSAAASIVAATTGIRLADGSALTIRNLLLVGFDVAVDIDGAATCALIGGGIAIENSVIATTGAFGDTDVDTGCAGSPDSEESALLSASILRVTDATEVGNLMKAAFSADLPDFRSISASSLASSTPILPPANGFFLPSQYIGAVEQARVSGTNLPWHAGWTIGGTVTPVNAFGSLTGIVTSVERGPLNGARVEAGGLSTLTGPDGAYTLNGVLAGAQLVAVTTSPAGCTPPVPASVSVVAGAMSTRDVNVPCTTVAITTSGMVLTYMCDNRFRVRNPNDAIVPVTWDVAGVSESGALTLPARPLGSGFSESFFNTVATGTVRLFYNGVLVQTKANGGFVCTP